MERRTFLAGAGAVGLTAAAGCVVDGRPLVGTVDLGEPERVSNDNDTYVTYSRDGADLLTVAIGESGWQPEGRVDFTLSAWHRDETHLDSIRYEIRLRTEPGEVAPSLYLERMGGSPWPEITFERGQDPGTTVLEVAPLEEQGDGTVLFDLVAEPLPEGDSLPVEVSFEAVLSGGGLGTYRASDRLERTLSGDNT